MDSIDSLAVDVAAAHWRLDTLAGWRARIERAVAGSNFALVALVGTAFTDRALALVSRLRIEREVARVRGNGGHAAARGSSTALGDFCDGGQRMGPARRGEFVDPHGNTVRPGAPTHEVA